MDARFQAPWFFVAALLLSLSLSATAQTAASAPPAPPAPELPLFAVEIKTGAKWDAAKPPQEQAFFREHSANLKRLRDAGHLVMGARYGDKGLVVLAAENEAAARAMMDQDPAIKAETFKYEINAFNVFYAGALNARPRRPAQ